MLRRLPPAAVLAGAWLVAVLYAFPGYMNYDAADQLYGARRHYFDDWHPPLMARYWRLIDHVIRGPFGMLVLQLTLFLAALYFLLRARFSPRTSAWTAAALLLFPPVLAPMAVVWKDAQMAAWLLAGLVLALRLPRWSRGVGIAMLVFGCGVRDNGVVAVLPLCVLIAARWGFRRKLHVAAVALGLWLGVSGTALLVNRALANHQSHAWYKGTAIHDLAGTLCLEDPMSDDEVRAALEGIPLLVTSSLQTHLCQDYDPAWWFPLSLGETNNVFDWNPDVNDRSARRDAWFRVVRAHPYTYLSHRWLVMRELLGLSSQGTNEPVCQTFAANEKQLEVLHHQATLSWLQVRLGQVFSWLATTILFRPWAYLVGCALLAIYALRKRDALVVTLMASAIAYEAAYFVFAPGPAFRYSHWMIAMCCIGIAIVFITRVRDARGTHPT